MPVAGGGKGVVVGIVDLGGDFAHRNSRTANGKTRLLSIWDQSGSAGPSSPFGYGRAHDRASIDAVLKTADPYATLGYDPRSDDPAHGTHVMDIAAGNGRGSTVAGVASEADLVFVEVHAGDIEWNGPKAVGSSFGDSARLIEAIRYVFDTAGDRPCVVNVSLGTNGGPHDGSTPVERGIDRMLAERPNRAVVIAASNSQSDLIHTGGHLATGRAIDLRWRLPNSRPTNKEMEIWCGGADRMAVELIGPDGASIGRVEPGSQAKAGDGDAMSLFVSNRLADPTNGDNSIGVYIAAGMPAGVWTVRLHALSVTGDGAFHAWIERDDEGQSSFESPSMSQTHTIGSIGCGRDTIVVGSYDAHRPGTPLSFFSSAGPTRDGRRKPEISAPGHDVWAAHSGTGGGVTLMSGTSMAAPATTGAIALLFAAASARGIDLPIARTREIAAAAARRGPPTGIGWHDRYGEGRVDAAGMIALLGSPPAPAGVAAKRTSATALRKPRKAPK